MSDQEKKKKYEEIADIILADIKSGVYKPGENIPPIRHLAQEFGVNPQTVNKATAHLATLGYLEGRQGSGSVVLKPEDRMDRGVFIPMLIDAERSKLLDQPDSALSYHSKDIYLSYLMNMNRLGNRAKFYVYDRHGAEVNTALQHDADQFSGVIVQGTLPDSYYSFFATRNIPVVLINRKPPEGISGRFASVLIDISRIREMIDYLVSLNHKKILYCQSTEYEENFVYRQRLEAAAEAVRPWEMEYPMEIRTFRFDANSPLSLEEFRSLADEGFSAAFCYNDVTALRLYGLVRNAKLSIPHDFSITGFDDIFASHLATPSLTTIRVVRPALVSRAIELLEKLISDENSGYIEEILPSELVIRKSTFARK